MRVVVVGAGGVGGYFGGQLAAAGHDVLFIARGRQQRALAEHGLQVASNHAPVSLAQVAVTDDIAAADCADLVLIAVKLWDTESVAQQLVSLAAAGAAVLSLQNGVQKDETLQRHLPSSAVLGGVCYISAAIESPGVIRHRGPGARRLRRVRRPPERASRRHRGGAVGRRGRHGAVDRYLSRAVAQVHLLGRVVVHDQRCSPADRRTASEPSDACAHAPRHGRGRGRGPGSGGRHPGDLRGRAGGVHRHAAAGDELLHAP